MRKFFTFFLTITLVLFGVGYAFGGSAIFTKYSTSNGMYVYQLDLLNYIRNLTTTFGSWSNKIILDRYNMPLAWNSIENIFKSFINIFISFYNTALIPVAIFSYVYECLFALFGIDTSGWLGSMFYGLSYLQFEYIPIN